MMRKGLEVIVLILISGFLFLIVFSGSVSAVSCDDTITVDTTLDSDLSCTYIGIIIGADGITLDGAGHTITGSGSDPRQGVLMNGRKNITIKNLKIKNFSTGIFVVALAIDNNTVVYSSDNTLIGNDLSDNEYGIFFSYSSGNTVIDNTINSNGWGIVLASSGGNTLKGNTITSNIYEGLVIQRVSGNLIYNNKFNNDLNIRFYGTDTTNQWSATKASGTNIIGGSWEGGNFWGNPSGTGFSETCTDADQDGICDSSYTLYFGNVDNLPLTNVPPPTTTAPPTTTPAPTTAPPTTTPAPTPPKIVLLANSIDYELATEFLGFLGNKGMETVHANASDFEQYKEEKFIVILGGPDAYEGVGEIVQEVLSEAEQNAIREKGARKKYVKTNIWTQGQRVMVIAGSDRNETKNTEDENQDSVVSEAESSS